MKTRTIYARTKAGRFTGQAHARSVFAKLYAKVFCARASLTVLASLRFSQSSTVQFTMLPDMEELTQDDHDTAATGATAAAGRPSRERRKLFVMRSGSRLFAIPADAVEATSENLTPTPLPFAPAPVRGLVSQRGRILTVIDPLLLLPSVAPSTGATLDAPQHASPPTQASAPLIVALRGDEQLALAVERIEPDIELFDDDEADATTHASPNSHPCVRRTIQHHAGAIALLDPAHLFEAAMQGVERRRRRQ